MNDEPLYWLDVPALDLVAEFHTIFELPIKQECITVEDLDTAAAEMRMSLIAEEFNELREAFESRDLIGFIDAIQDLKYVLYGAELHLGIAGEDHFQEVHRANMSKANPDGSVNRRADGKILKSPDWSPPDHDLVLAAVRARSRVYFGAPDLLEEPPQASAA